MNCQCILQVEDEEADVFLLKRAFKKAGIASPVHVVTDGQMAIDYLAGKGAFSDRKQHPLCCLVLLDLKLPKVGGLEVLAWIRGQPHLRKLVVVIFSASAQPGDIERAYHLGANSFIQKPSDPERLLEITQLLKGWWLGYNHYAPIHETPPPTEPQRLP
jgi:CheY-like chemotaxis protein